MVSVVPSHEVLSSHVFTKWISAPSFKVQLSCPSPKKYFSDLYICVGTLRFWWNICGVTIVSLQLWVSCLGIWWTFSVLLESNNSWVLSSPPPVFAKELLVRTQPCLSLSFWLELIHCGTAEWSHHDSGCIEHTFNTWLSSNELCQPLLKAIRSFKTGIMLIWSILSAPCRYHHFWYAFLVQQKDV